MTKIHVDFRWAIDEMDAPTLARSLRRLGENGGAVSPGFLAALADMLDSPPGYKGSKLKLSRPRGGKVAEFDWEAIGRAAHAEICSGVKRLSVYTEIAEHFGCDARTVRRALAIYRDVFDPDNETAD